MVHTAESSAAPEELFRRVAALGGKRGWLSWNWAWQIRAVIDRILGGPGLQPGRRHPTDLAVDDPVDWWVVEEIRSPERLRLYSRMKLPGEGWLEFRVARTPSGGSKLVQMALFEPSGLFGRLYWWGLYLPHRIILGGLAGEVVRAAGFEPATPSSGD
ncbi:MAG: DUF2867 domain-containing protein [Acidobacteria bacterium]|uniref:DUF2867 domain-containing protein n=1 Tax=Candidatus Polarisedimenticola svalbardensis TaxID=2886004 RepID=A0A8J6Y720_9BACT|nr:DUF2867 domain-containing protein [Candidatus Polarisedimenticola svalbardensis]